jgi:hypothetical protein
MKKIIIIFVISIMFPFIAHSEIYKNIESLDSLGDLKTKFPKANFKLLNPAWAKDSDVMYQITGEGMSGTIIVKLHDPRPYWKDYIAKTPDENLETFKSLADQTDDEAITVEWVRWIPFSPIPLARFISKYGKPEKSGFADEDLQPFRHWENRGLIAYLTDDEKNVYRVDFEFTLDEMRKAYKSKYNMIPPWLKINDVPTTKESVYKKKSTKKINGK